MEKNNFQTLAENRIDILNRLVMDDALGRCLLNKSKKFKDDIVTPIEKAGLMYKQVFPYLKTTGTLTDSKSYITMKFEYRKVKGGNFYKTASITIYAFCHESIITTPYGIIRSDYIIQQIDRLLNDTRAEGWIGKLSLNNMADIIIDKDYIGFAVTYVNTEFQ